MIAGFLLAGKDNRNAQDDAFISRNPKVSPVRTSSTHDITPDNVKGARRHDRPEPITPESAAARMVEALKITDMVKRSDAASEIIAELCRKGYVDEAWKLIDINFGSVREWQVSAFFRNANLDVPTLIDRIESLPASEDVKSAFSANLAGRDLQGINSLLNYPAFKSYFERTKKDNPELLRALLTQDLYKRIAIGDDNEGKKEAIKVAFTLHSKGLIDDNGLSRLIGNDTSTGPFEKWDLVVDSIKSTKAESNPGALRGSVIDRMVENDAQGALARITKVSGEQGSWDLYSGLKKWSEMAPGAANSWYLTHQAQLSAEQRDGAARAFCQMAVEVEEFDTAARWANQIQDPKLREQILNKFPKEHKSP